VWPADNDELIMSFSWFDHADYLENNRYAVDDLRFAYVPLRLCPSELRFGEPL
jgi:hypothetical protein